jgi:hypothetical protein
LLFTTNTARADLQANFESPANNDIVSGVAVIRGWAFDTTPSGQITGIQLTIDGVSQGNVACCTQRPDVAAAPQFASFPNALNSGFGITTNWGNYTDGLHTIRVQITSTTGTFDSGERTVTVVRAAGFDFLDQFSMDLELGFSEISEEGDILVECIQVRDASSGSTAFVNATFRWQQGCQCLVMINSVVNEDC